MQLTIEIPDDLAERLAPEREHLAEIIERGLRRQWSETAGLAREVISFLASGPKPAGIIAFRPSQAYLERSRELLRRSEAGSLTPSEEAELDEMAHLDHLVGMIKAEARHHLRARP